jgi:succinate dehydrogenase / fumarate reductase, iron-sulfur subunit
MLLKVFRYRKGGGAGYDSFQVPIDKGMTVLDALFYARDNFDDGLSFRYSCRGAVCGTCAMLINHVPRLACRTQLESLLKMKDAPALAYSPALDRGESFVPSTEVLVEPLPNLPIEKDLVVDMAGFFNKYRLVHPTLKGRDIGKMEEHLMFKEDVKELERYTNCVLCAACYSACPVNAAKPGFLGPAALAKLYRFAIDPREGRKMERLSSADEPDGWWGCEFHANCVKVCPKGVPPNLAIGKAQKELRDSSERRRD